MKAPVHKVQVTSMTSLTHFLMKLYKSLPQPEGLQSLASKDVCGLDIIAAARIIEDMEASGIVSSMNSAGNREVLAPGPIEPDD